jgi:hypothetical protein
MLLGFSMGVLGYALMLVAMTYVIVHSHRMIFKLRCRDISWLFAQAWHLGSLYLDAFIRAHKDLVAVLSILVRMATQNPLFV